MPQNYKWFEELSKEQEIELVGVLKNSLILSPGRSVGFEPRHTKNDFALDTARDWITGKTKKESEMKIKKIDFYFDFGRRSTVCVYHSEVLKTWGIARLHPEDEIDPVMGRKISLARAIEGFSKQGRIKVWEYYFKKFPKDKLLREKKNGNEINRG